MNHPLSPEILTSVTPLTDEDRLAEYYRKRILLGDIKWFQATPHRPLQFRSTASAPELLSEEIPVDRTGSGALVFPFQLRAVK